MLSRQSPDRPAEQPSPESSALHHADVKYQQSGITGSVGGANKENNRSASYCEELRESPHVQVRDINTVLRVIDLTGSSPPSYPESELIRKESSVRELEAEFLRDAKAEDDGSSPSFRCDCDESVCQAEKSEIDSENLPRRKFADRP